MIHTVLTKEALPKRNADGMKPGRPVGGAKKLRLDPMASMFDDNLAKGHRQAINCQAAGRAARDHIRQAQGSTDRG